MRGLDFRDYARASLRRLIQNRLRAEKIDTIMRLLDKILHDASSMDRLKSLQPTPVRARPCGHRRRGFWQ